MSLTVWKRSMGPSNATLSQIILSLLFIFISCLGQSHGNDPGVSQRHLWDTWCLQDEFCMPRTECKSVITGGDWKICMDHVQTAINSNTCLVYSVGIADDWRFDVTMAQLGCEVHSFDPTIDPPKVALHPNITFHNYGLYGGSNTSTAKTFSHSIYGAIKGKMYTIGELLKILGHENRAITVFKMDCEGCEWEVFGSDNVRPHEFKNIKQLLTEFHYSTTLHFGDIGNAILASNTFHNLFPSFHYDLEKEKSTIHHVPLKRFFYHKNNGFDQDRNILSELQALGFPPRICCREMGFIRSED